MKKENFIYKRILRPAFFSLDPEKAHDTAIIFLRALNAVPFKKKLISFFFKETKKELEIAGIKFKNPLGLAAGFDKNAEVYPVLALMGFGFIETGTITFKAQPGSPKPRLFRYPENMALVNKMGFNNCGAEKAAQNFRKNGKISVPLGISVGKNSDCPIEKAPENYAAAFEILASYGDFFSINVSCPNIQNLSLLHAQHYLEKIFSAYRKAAGEKPVFLKIAPDLNDEELKNVISVCAKYKAGLIASNTLPAEKAGYPQKGGLSGRPLSMLALNCLSRIRAISKDIPLISSGGIFSASDLKLRFEAGADLAQIYTAMIYEGPFTAQNILSGLK